ncbi:hypothetical protein FO519_008463 [Halicephalobus sp. NKZ332]|nr:hypothetical protein FO519_008463 [Halicephalobus sp. NKZ332]
MGTSKKSFDVSSFYFKENEKQKAEELLRFQKLLADDPGFYDVIWKFADHPTAKELIEWFLKDDVDGYMRFLDSKKREIENLYLRKEVLLELYRYSKIWKMVQFSQKSCILLSDRYLTLKLTKKAKICEKIRELIVDCLGYYPTSEGVEIPVDQAAQSLAVAIISVPNSTVPILLNILQLYKANNTPRSVVREIMKKVMNFVHLRIPSLCIKVAFLALLDISKEPEKKEEGDLVLDEVLEEFIKEPCFRDPEALIMLPIATGKADHQLLFYCVGKGKFLQLKEASNENKTSEIAVETSRKNFLMKMIEKKEPVAVSFSVLGEYLGSSESPWTESQNQLASSDFNRYSSNFGYPQNPQ